MNRVIINIALISITCALLVGANQVNEANDDIVIPVPTVPVTVIKKPSPAIVEQSIDDDGDNDSAVPEKPRGRWVRALVTAYTPWDAIDSNSGYQDGYTSTMVDTNSINPDKIYGIAADPRAIPYGTRIYVPGYWESLQNNKMSVPSRVVVDDTGGNMRKNWDKGILHIDVRYRTSRAARKWGKRWVDIFIYEE